VCEVCELGRRPARCWHQLVGFAQQPDVDVDLVDLAGLPAPDALAIEL
jgi:hypothetical protein